MDWLAIGAGVALGLSIATLAAFFATKNERFDRVAEWSFVALAILAIPTMLRVGERLAAAGIAAQALTVVGIVGVAVVGLGELLSALKLVDFRKVSAAVAVGFMGVLAWVGGASVLALTGGGLPVAQAWLGIGSIVLALGMMTLIMRTPGVMSGEREPSQATMLSFFVPIAGIVAWMLWLGVSLG